jgi:hypothetical protein
VILQRKKKMANVSRKWKSSTWRLGKSRAKEPEMVESPLPYGWSFAHDLDHREQVSLGFKVS